MYLYDVVMRIANVWKTVTTFCFFRSKLERRETTIAIHTGICLSVQLYACIERHYYKIQRESVITKSATVGTIHWTRGQHEMSLSRRYHNRGFFYIILGQCTETMFCLVYRNSAIERAMYVTDNALASPLVVTKQRISYSFEER